jgi:hypothetical protein
MPEIDVSTFANMDPTTLELKRRGLVDKAQGNHDNLDLDDLRELAAITAVLRRRASGPPKAAKKAGAKKTKAGPATADDLA